MAESIVDVSRGFFFDVLLPILRKEFPVETSQTAFGVFGYGSEVLGLDDEYSSDHHWGIRINALMPDYLIRGRLEQIQSVIDADLPDSYQGHSLREGLTGGRGLSLTSLEAYLARTIGIAKPPETDLEWLSIPEEDIIHIVNGEIWLDESGCFAAIRRAFGSYYPEPVRLRRIAHWCRYMSGMGVYALKRALLRQNDYYATITFARALRLGVQMAFMLEKVYCPYDKWTYAFLPRLPRLGQPVQAIVDESTRLSTPWSVKLDLLHELADLLDHTMVSDGIIPPHPAFAISPTSGYRLLEHAYAEILRQLTPELRSIVPVWDQVHMEVFHSNYVAGLDINTWDGLLNLTSFRRDSASSPGEAK